MSYIPIMFYRKKNLMIKKKRRGKNKKIHERILCQRKDLSFFPSLPSPSHSAWLYSFIISDFHSSFSFLLPFLLFNQIEFAGFYSNVKRFFLLLRFFLIFSNNNKFELNSHVIAFGVQISFFSVYVSCVTKIDEFSVCVASS